DRVHSAADGAVGRDPLVSAGNTALERQDSLAEGGCTDLVQLSALALHADVVIPSYATVVEGPAQQLINRAAKHLAADVPKCLINARERRAQDRTAAEKGMNVE